MMLYLLKKRPCFIHVLPVVAFVPQHQSLIIMTEKAHRVQARSGLAPVARRAAP